ncbi:MAG: hypothetical protein H0T66_12235 [Geodermatophilaceae bacterium]|nr:hypothetical protein [Geodermatophilaceae bacterium]
MDLVRSELTGLAALRRDTDLVVPEPVRTRNGDLLAVASAPGVPRRGSATCCAGWTAGSSTPP